MNKQLLKILIIIITFCFGLLCIVDKTFSGVPYFAMLIGIVCMIADYLMD